MNKAKRKRNVGFGRTNKSTVFNLKILIALNCQSTKYIEGIRSEFTVILINKPAKCIMTIA